MLAINGFLEESKAEEIYKFLAKDMNLHWWKAVFYPWPGISGFGSFVLTPESQEKIKEERERVFKDLVSGGFSYTFKRSLNDHFSGCWCFQCGYEKFMRSNTACDFVSQIIGTPLTEASTVFSSWYDDGDFLGTHSDTGLGKVAFVYNLSKNWKYVYGGNLTIFEFDWKTPKRIFVPAFNTLILFKVPEGSGIPHCVTPVVSGVNKSGEKRLALSGWYT